MAPSIYVGSATVAPALFWLFGRTGPFDAFFFQYGVLPLVVVGVTIGLTRLWSPAPSALEITIAGFWCTTLLSIALSPPLYRWAQQAGQAGQRVGQTAVDGHAVLLGITAAALGGLAAYSLAGARSSGSVSWAWRLLQAIGLGIMACYLGRASLVLYASTRISESRGLAGISAEAALRVLVSLMSVLAFAGSAVAQTVRRAPR
jgi:hypothetical protein